MRKGVLLFYLLDHLVGRRILWKDVVFRHGRATSTGSTKDLKVHDQLRAGKFTKRGTRTCDYDARIWSCTGPSRPESLTSALAVLQNPLLSPDGRNTL